MPGRTYRFAGFELDEQRFELRRAGVLVRVPPKVMDMLLLLVRHHDRVLTKEELFARVWPGTTVTDASLGKAVGVARRALGDTVAEQRFIRTVHGRGLRFVALLEHDGDAPSPAVDAPAGEVGFVGRDDVLASIAAAVAAAETGAGRLVLLAGEPGMGKTRTTQEAAARARAAGSSVLTAWCHDGEGAPDLWPWLQVVRQLGMERDAHRLTAGLDEGLADLVALVPAIGGPSWRRPPPAPLDPEQARFRLFDTIVELLRRGAAARAILIVLDDAHCMDAASLGLLDFLTRVLPDSRLAVVVTYRAEDVAAGHPLLELARRPGALRLALRGLDHIEVARLVEIATRRPAAPAVVDRLHERTEGNPFFVTELARALAAAGHLDAVAAEDVPLPAGVHEVLRQRLRRLTPACRRALGVAVAIGPEFDVGLLARVIGETVETVLAWLDDASAAHVVHAADGRFRCAHALIREALLEETPHADRARLHRAIGEAIERTHGGDVEPHLAQLAHHFCAGAPAGVARKAIDYARRAGDRATLLLAHDEAAQQYRQALVAQTLLPATDERERAELLLALGDVLMRAGRRRDGRETLRRAAELARRHGAPEMLGRAALAAGGLTLSPEVGVPDPELVASLEEALAVVPETAGPLRVRLLVRLGFALPWTPVQGRSGDVSEEAVALARRIGDPVSLGVALYGHRWSLRGPDECDAKLAASDEILALARDAAHRELELAGRASRFQVLLELGRTEEADVELAIYRRLAGELRVPRYRWRASFYRAMRALLAGRLAESEALAIEAQAEEQRYTPGDAGQVFGVQMLLVRREQDRLAEIEPGLQFLIARFPSMPALRATQALAAAELGREAEARRGLESLVDADLRALPREFLWLASMAVLSELCARLGDAGRAKILYEALRPHAPRAVMVGAGSACLGAVDRPLGLLAATMGDVAAARRHLEAARDFDARMHGYPWLGWTELELARLLARSAPQRARRRGHEHLHRAREIARPRGLARLLRHADEVADLLG